MKREISLTPAQQAAFDALLGGISAGGVLVLQGESGMGKTTILRQAHARLGGAFVGVRQFMSTLVSGQPVAIEEAFLAMIEQAVARHDLVIVDDLHLVTNVVDNYQYSRRYLLDAALTSILAKQERGGRSCCSAYAAMRPGPCSGAPTSGKSQRLPPPTTPSCAMRIWTASWTTPGFTVSLPASVGVN